MKKTIEFGARLRAARIAAGFSSLRTFAIQHKIPVVTYCQHETGARSPDLETIKFYSEALSVNSKWLTTGHGQPFKEQGRLKNINEKELSYVAEMSKLMGTHAMTFNEDLLAKLLEELLTFHDMLKPKRSLKKVIHETLSLYKDIIQASPKREAQVKMISPAVNAYKRQSKSK